MYILKLEKVEPIGHREATVASWTGTQPPYAIMVEVYPDSSEGRMLRARRLRLGLSIAAAAKLLWVSAVELSGLESGRYTCDWGEAMKRLRGEP